MFFIRNVWSRDTLFLLIYLIIGIAVNTAAPHLPNAHAANTGDMLHSWAQYFISVVSWPLSFWHPTFTVGQWTP
jgi:hypothetical protein